MCEQSAKHHGGAVVRAVQDRAVRCVFAILPTPTAALEMATLLMLRVSTELKDTAKHDGRGGDVDDGDEGDGRASAARLRNPTRRGRSGAQRRQQHREAEVEALLRQARL